MPRRAASSATPGRAPTSAAARHPPRPRAGALRRSPPPLPGRPSGTEVLGRLGRVRSLRLLVSGFALGAFMATVHLVGSDAVWFRRLETTAFDLGLQLRGPKQPGPETVIVLVDERTIAEFGRWPLPRR